MSESSVWQGYYIRRTLGKERRGDERRDYATHVMGREELLLTVGKCIGIVILFTRYFYRSIWAALPLGILGAGYGKHLRKVQALEDRHQLLLQFCDMLQAVSAALRAGYSVENAFLESYEDMCLMHGENAMICQEIRLLCRGLEMNRTLEDLLEDLGRRSHVPQIREFASVFSIGYHSSGNLSQIIQMTTESMLRRMELREEILTQTAARRMECSIMNGMPFAILTYIEVTNRGYFDLLYHNLTGVLIMSGCLAGYLAAYLWAQKILKQALEAEV